MRLALGLFSALGLSLMACNANPLLKAAASDYAPIRVGSSWSYRSLDGSITLDRAVVGAGSWDGKEAFTIATRVNGGPASNSYLAFEQGDLLQHSASLGWILYRRLPLVNGNKWTVPSVNPLVTQVTVVDGIEKASVAMGDFETSFKVRTRTETYDPGSDVTATAEVVAWAAPGVGDVRYANLAGDGTLTTTFELVGYTIP